MHIPKNECFLFPSNFNANLRLGCSELTSTNMFSIEATFIVLTISLMQLSKSLTSSLMVGSHFKGHISDNSDHNSIYKPSIRLKVPSCACI